MSYRYEPTRDPLERLPPEMRDAITQQALARAAQIAENHAKAGAHWNLERRAIEVQNQIREIGGDLKKRLEALKEYRKADNYDPARYASGRVK